MRTAAILALILAGSASAALALEIPRGASQDSRVRFVDYQPYNITRIIGSLRSSVQVEFAADEEIAHVALGNSVAWEVAPAGNILFLKPRENQPITNISVVTTRRDGSTRSYQMELTVRDGTVEAGQNTYRFSASMGRASQDRRSVATWVNGRSLPRRSERDLELRVA
ncbi:type IV secretory pathway VirB9-like protein (plasmid) [Ensifer sp. WSM1721]